MRVLPCLLIIGLLIVPFVKAEETQKPDRSIEAVWMVSRYSLLDSEFKKPAIGINFIPKKFQYVDFITLIGTEDENLVAEDTVYEVGLGMRTNFEGLNLSDRIDKFLTNALKIRLPENLKVGPNLNPYFIVDPAETVRRLLNDDKFDNEFLREYMDIGVMVEFVKWEMKF